MSFIEALRQDKRFIQLVSPIPNKPEIEDADYYIRKDGILFNADGYAHLEGFILGNPLYIPDQNGNKALFNQRYRKTFFYPGTNEPIPYKDRPSILKQIDPTLDQSKLNNVELVAWIPYIFLD